MRVLYVEDDDDNAYMLARRLARHGIEVTQAPSVADALKSLAQAQPDAVLLDLHLPDASGMTVLHQLRADPLTRALPVVVVSAHVMGDERREALAKGANAFLPKPLDFRRLLDTLQTLTSSGSAAGELPQ